MVPQGWSGQWERASGFPISLPGWCTRANWKQEREGPACLLAIQLLGSMEIGEVFMVCEDFKLLWGAVRACANSWTLTDLH